MRLLTTWLEKSEHEVHALRKEIRTRQPDPMAPHLKGCGRILMSLVNYKGSWSLWRTNINCRSMRVRHRCIQWGSRHRSLNHESEFVGVPAHVEQVAGSLPGVGIPPPPRMTCHPCGRMKSGSGVEPQVVEGVGAAPTKDTPRLAWGVIRGIAPRWTSGTLRRTARAGLCHGWYFSCSTDKTL